MISYRSVLQSINIVMHFHNNLSFLACGWRSYEWGVNKTKEVTTVCNGSYRSKRKFGKV